VHSKRGEEGEKYNLSILSPPLFLWTPTCLSTPPTSLRWLVTTTTAATTVVVVVFVERRRSGGRRRRGGKRRRRRMEKN